MTKETAGRKLLEAILDEISAGPDPLITAVTRMETQDPVLGYLLNCPWGDHIELYAITAPSASRWIPNSTKRALRELTPTRRHLKFIIPALQSRGKIRERLERGLRLHRKGWLAEECFLEGCRRAQEWYPHHIAGVKRADPETDLEEGVDFFVFFTIPGSKKPKCIAIDVKSSPRSRRLLPYKPEHPNVMIFTFSHDVERSRETAIIETAQTLKQLADRLRREAANASPEADPP